MRGVCPREEEWKGESDTFPGYDVHSTNARGVSIPGRRRMDLVHSIMAEGRPPGINFFSAD